MKFKIVVLVLLSLVALNLLYFDIQLYRIGNAFENLGSDLKDIPEYEPPSIEEIWPSTSPAPHTTEGGG